MLRAYFVELEVPDLRIDAPGQIPVFQQRLVLRSGALLQLQDIFRVLGEGLAVVHLVALLDLPLKVHGGPLDGLLHLAFRHARFRLPGSVVPYLFAVQVAPMGDGDFEGRAALSVNSFYCCHYRTPAPCLHLHCMEILRNRRIPEESFCT